MRVIRELLEEVGLAYESEKEIDKVVCNIEECTKDSLFIAICGTHFDSHVHLGRAKELNAMTMSDYGQGGDIEVANTKEYYAPLVLAMCGNPQNFLTLIGVSGTNGKSSVSYAIYHGLQALGYEACLCSTDGFFFSNEIMSNSQTTPSIERLSEVLMNCVERGIHYFVMEVSSHALAQGRIYGFKFDTFVYTNLGHDHLDYHASFMNYRDAKEKGMRYLREGGFVVLTQDEMIQSMVHSIAVPYICLGEGAYMYEFEWETMGCCVKFRGNEFHLPFSCDFQVTNLLLAACVLLRYGEEKRVLEWIKQGIKMPGRMERVYEGEFQIYVDYAHSVEAFEAVGRNVGRNSNEKWIVFGLGGERDTSKRAVIGRLMEEYFDYIVLTTDNSRGENPLAICNEIALEMKDKPMIILNRKDAIEYAISNISKHGIIVVAGKGNEAMMKVADELIPFKDSDVIRQILVKRGFFYAI